MKTALFPFRSPRPIENPKARMFCFPFAGGAASIYKAWTEQFAKDKIDVCAVELAGRGTRFGETPISDPEVLVTHLAKELTPFCNQNIPVVWFGHSLGARLAFALARRLNRSDAFIASGARSPARQTRIKRSHLTREDFVASLKTLGGTPDEILADPELLDLFLPMLRADFNVVEKLLSSPSDTIASPLKSLAAADDRECDEAESLVWRDHTTGSFESALKKDGGHFFLTSDPDWVYGEVRSFLATTIAIT
jgi:medium-chain acyl-[acyl-carrier-protein] hydrolase